MAPATASTPGIRLPPPVIYLAAIGVGLWLNGRWPIAPLPATPAYVMGALFIVIGLAIVLASLLRFRRANTPFNVYKAATALVTDGPYRFSRNPGYLALTLFYLGVSSLLRNYWLFIMVIPALLVTDLWIVRREERHLETRFGEDYRRYKAAVRRWL